LIALEIETRDKVMALAKEIEQRPGVKWTDADKARRTALRKEAETARDRLLTPEEQAELKLRNSGESRWAQNLSGFEATQDEWHAVTQLKITNRDAVKSLNDAKLPDAERQAKTEAMDAELNSAIRASLGAERFAQMESAKDGDFQNARRVTKRYGLNDSLARETAQLQKTAVANAKLVRDDATLSPEARASTLAAIAQESRRTLTATLGSRVFTTYEKYSGDWLKELTHTPDENSGQ
jgi:hypothetical protein